MEVLKKRLDEKTVPTLLVLAQIVVAQSWNKQRPLLIKYWYEKLVDIFLIV